MILWSMKESVNKGRMRMNRKTRLLAAALAMMMTVLMLVPAGAEEEFDSLEFFRCLAGRITFTMDHAPRVFYDADLLRESASQEDAENWMTEVRWKNKVQLHVSDEKSEIQYHIADISDTIAILREEYPDDPEELSVVNALSRFAALSVMLTGGNPLDEEPALTWHRQDAYGEVTFDFCYDDVPDEVYHCHGFVDGTTVVLMLGNECERYRTLHEQFGLADAEQVTRLTEKRQERTEMIGHLFVTFPNESVRMSDEEGYSYIAGFTENYETFTAEYLEADLGALIDGTVTDELLLVFTKGVGEGAAEDYGAESWDAEMFAEGIAVAKLHFAPDILVAYPREIWCFLTPDATYTFYGSASEAGMAFLNSIHLPAER